MSVDSGPSVKARSASTWNELGSMPLGITRHGCLQRSIPSANALDGAPPTSLTDFRPLIGQPPAPRCDGGSPCRTRVSQARGRRFEPLSAAQERASVSRGCGAGASSCGVHRVEVIHWAMRAPAPRTRVQRPRQSRSRRRLQVAVPGLLSQAEPKAPVSFRPARWGGRFGPARSLRR